MDNWGCKPLKMELFHPTKSLVTLGSSCGPLNARCCSQSLKRQAMPHCCNHAVSGKPNGSSKEFSIDHRD